MLSVVLRVAAACSAVSWLVFPGFGVPHLPVTRDPAWPVVPEAGWGLFAAVLVAAALLAVAARPRSCAAPLVQPWTATAALAVSALAGAEVPLVSLVGLLALQSAVVTGPAVSLPGHRPIRPVAVAPSHPLLAVAVAGAVPWTLHTLAMYRANRRSAAWGIAVASIALTASPGRLLQPRRSARTPVDRSSWAPSRPEHGGDVGPAGA